VNNATAVTALDTADGAPQIRLSVGVARFPEDAATGADLLERRSRRKDGRATVADDARSHLRTSTAVQTPR
jgi:5-hydroxyisourate hydrolase-like protein (transthyretin family)